MRSAVIILAVVSAVTAEAPYHLPRPAPHAPAFVYPSGPAPSLPPPPPAPFPQLPQPRPQQPFTPFPHQPAQPPSFTSHQGYNYQQPSFGPAFVYHAPHPPPQPAQHPIPVHPSLPHPIPVHPPPPHPIPLHPSPHHPIPVHPPSPPVHPAPQPKPVPVHPPPPPVYLPAPQPQPLPIPHPHPINYPQPVHYPQLQPVHYPAPEPQPLPISYPQPQPQPILPPQPSYGVPQPQPHPQPQPQQLPGYNFNVPQAPTAPLAPLPVPILHQPQAPQPFTSLNHAAIAHHYHQLASQGYSYPQPISHPTQFAVPLPLQSHPLTNNAVSSYQADSNQYSSAHSEIHKEALDETVVDRVQNIIKENEHSSAKQAGYLSLVSGVSLENARSSVEISSFVHTSPQDNAGLIDVRSSSSSATPSSSSSSAGASLTSYDAPTISAGSSLSDSSTIHGFLPNNRPAISYGVPN